jgi:uncharacterized membrane protein
LTDSANRLRALRGLLLLAAGFGFLVFAWPLFAQFMIENFGVRVLAGSMIAVSAVSLRAAGGGIPSEYALRGLDLAVLFALAGLALATGQRLFLLLIPAWLYVALARIFVQSLRGGGSLIETVAMQLQPYAPDFIRPYCRKVTLLWAGLFALNAAAIAGLALFAPLGWWRAYTSWIVCLAFAAITLIEFGVRKAHFRIYDGGPIDSVFEYFFPAERTEMGRRASAYKIQMRRSLGRPERGR